MRVKPRACFIKRDRNTHQGACLMAKGKDWNDLHREGPGSIRGLADDPANDIPFEPEKAPPNGDARPARDKGRDAGAARGAEVGRFATLCDTLRVPERGRYPAALLALWWPLHSWRCHGGNRARRSRENDYKPVRSHHHGLQGASRLVSFWRRPKGRDRPAHCRPLAASPA